MGGLKTLGKLLLALASVAPLNPSSVVAGEGPSVIAAERARSRDEFGLGILLGEPSGLSARYISDGSRNSIDAGLSYSFSDYFLIFADYRWDFRRAFKTDVEFLNLAVPYVGVGALLAFSSGATKGAFTGSSAGFGVRIPLGSEWRIPSSPVGAFLELVPGLSIAPGMDAFFQGGIGARYYF